MSATVLPTSTSIQTIQLTKEGVRLLDQRLLPLEETYLTVTTPKQMHDAIQDMVVRGAPAIGVSGAYGVLLSARLLVDKPLEIALEQLHLDAEMLKASRPTAVNLAWAIDRLLNVVDTMEIDSTQDLLDCLEEEAAEIQEEDERMCQAIAEHGKNIMPKGAKILTCCNTGSLATTGIGTALGVIRAAYANDPSIHVYACETRPRLQGLKLTAWELKKDNIPFTVISDNAAAWLMNQGQVDCVIAGADRITKNGDTANKIGTYALALHAKAHHIPFFIAAPSSTVDENLETGKDIEIEERDPEEVTQIDGFDVGPNGLNVYNPAFDVTPAHLITGIITEDGVFAPQNLNA